MMEFGIDPEKWCSQNGWTELRKLDNGIWVAFPPSGIIETPLPYQSDPPPTKSEFSLIKACLYAMVIPLLIVAAAIATVWIGLCFLVTYPFSKKQFGDF